MILKQYKRKDIRDLTILICSGIFYLVAMTMFMTGKSSVWLLTSAAIALVLAFAWACINTLNEFR